MQVKSGSTIPQKHLPQLLGGNANPPNDMFHILCCGTVFIELRLNFICIKFYTIKKKTHAHMGEIVNSLFPFWQTKLSEEKNTALMQTNIGLEEELRKANATKGQLETYKRQVTPKPLPPYTCSCICNSHHLTMVTMISLSLGVGGRTSEQTVRGIEKG